MDAPTPAPLAPPPAPPVATMPGPQARRAEGGRQGTLLTPDLQRRLCQTLRMGNYMDAAAGHVGVSVSAIYEWLARGEGRSPRRARPEYVAFALAVRKALADAEVDAVALVIQDMRANPDGARWYLAHRYPERWGRTTVDVKLSLPKLADVLKGLSDDDMAQLATLLGVTFGALPGAVAVAAKDSL